jgi:PAS domain S-box-containing protein
MCVLALILDILSMKIRHNGDTVGLLTLNHEIMDYNDEETQERMFPFKTGEEQYHRMVEEIEDYAILMLDNHGIIQNWNKGAQKIKGYSEKEIVGQHFRVFYTKEDREAGLPEKLVAEAVLNGKALHEGWRVRKDGTTFWGSIVITALHDENAQVIGFSKVTRDLTERKMAEDKLLRYARQLETQNRELQQFAYAAAHDMKEPLRKMQFFYSAIKDEGLESFSKTQQSYLERSADAAKRMQRLIEDILAFAKLSEQETNLEPVDLNEVVEEVSAFFSDSLNEIQASIVASALPVVQAIPFQIRQLLVNLVSNSIKYRDVARPLRVEVSGGVVFNPGLGGREGYLPTRFLKLQVKDNGIGFDPENADRIFDMFERLHGREAFEGTGIGLSICRRVMENHKGYIRASGNPGEGAVFEMFFPL